MAWVTAAASYPVVVFLFLLFSRVPVLFSTIKGYPIRPDYLVLPQSLLQLTWGTQGLLEVPYTKSLRNN